MLVEQMLVEQEGSYVPRERRGSRIGRVGLFLLVAWALAGCDSAEEKQCLGLVEDAETRLLSMNIGDEQSVEFTLAGLEEARKVCEKAQMSAQVEDINEAIANTSRHLERMKSGEFQAAPPPPGPEALARLEKEGDPTCPLGQGYQHPLLKKVIKCRGPRMVEMTRAELADYFAKNRFTAAKKDSMLRGARGSLVYEATYRNADAVEPPACLVIEAPSSEQVAQLVSFATNVPVEKIVSEQPLTIEGQTVTWSMSTEDQGHRITLGSCEAEEPLMKRVSPLGQEKTQPEGEPAGQQPPGVGSAAGQGKAAPESEAAQAEAAQPAE